MSNEWIHIAEVVSVDDPERAGRLQIRVLDQHDHYIPNDELLWARCSFPVTSAVHRGVGGPTTGIVVGSTVMVVFMDEPYHQIPIVIGVLGRSMAPEGPNTLPMGPQGPTVLLSGDQLPENRSDFPPANIGQDVNPVLEEQITNMTRDALESADEETIADVPYQGEKIQDTISRKNNIVAGVS